MNRFDYINENLRHTQNRIAAAARKVGRKPEEITLVAVSKTHPATMIKAAVEFGLTQIGESRVQEAEPKITSLGPICRWHMIGHIQTNKAKKIVSLFDFVHSLDSEKLADEINRRAGQAGRKIECLIEVNSSGEKTKEGVAPDETIDLIKIIGSMENIDLRGLMTIAPFTDDEKPVRAAFRLTRSLFERGRGIVGDSFGILSMGMSDDFEIAIEEGSNMVRIGTALFGPRESR